jgi:hypothetical protein
LSYPGIHHRRDKNVQNGKGKKTLLTGHDKMEIVSPCDASFEIELVKKRQTQEISPD